MANILSFKNRIQANTGDYSLFTTWADDLGSISIDDAVQQFMIDGCNDVIDKIMKIKPDDVVFMTNESSSITSEVTSITDVQLVSVERDGIECRNIPFNIRKEISDVNSIYYASKFDPVYYVMNSNLNILPAPDATYTAKYHSIGSYTINSFLGDESGVIVTVSNGFIKNDSYPYDGNTPYSFACIGGSGTGLVLSATTTSNGESTGAVTVTNAGVGYKLTDVVNCLGTGSTPNATLGSADMYFTVDSLTSSLSSISNFPEKYEEHVILYSSIQLLMRMLLDYRQDSSATDTKFSAVETAIIDANDMLSNWGSFSGSGGTAGFDFKKLIEEEDIEEATTVLGGVQSKLSEVQTRLQNNNQEYQWMANQLKICVEKYIGKFA